MLSHPYYQMMIFCDKNSILSSVQYIGDGTDESNQACFINLKTFDTLELN